MRSINLQDLTIIQAQREMASGSLKARDLAESVIAKCEEMRFLNAFISNDWDHLRKAADEIDASGKAGIGLAGIPLCIKDNIATGIFPTGAATASLAVLPPGEPAPITKALTQAGALIGGTGNMHELAFGATNNNAFTGAARNPWNYNMIPGGSSGGVAVAVAARMMPAGIGTDTGASVRLPAALCGIVGFRPTVGRYSSERIVPISHTRDTAGPMARSVADIQLLDSVLSGQSISPERITLKGLRLGVPREYFYGPLDSDIASCTENALCLLKKAGVELIEADIPDLEKINTAVSSPVVSHEFIVDLQQYLNDNAIPLTLQQICNGVKSPDVRKIFEDLLVEKDSSQTAYQAAIQSYRPQLQANYRNYFAKHNVDAVIFPTSAMTARPIGQDTTVDLNGRQTPTFSSFIRNVDPGSNAGIPGISLPIGLSRDRLPIGIEIDGPMGSDQRLLAIAAALETVFVFTQQPRLN